jgi:CheY-like chemotaxis protein
MKIAMKRKSCKNALENKTVLLVEDNEINIKVATLLLKDCGIQNIIAARTGKEALTHLSSAIDLIILDIGLPDIDGLELCGEIRRLLEGKPIPIIACTANDELEKECKLAGMNGFIVKPVTISAYKSIIGSYL